MGRLVIEQLIYDGDNYEFVSPKFSNGLNLISGVNGSGKSTFFHLLYYSLGGSVKEFKRNDRDFHTQIVNDSNNYVETAILIDDNHFILRRYIGKSEISILSEEGSVLILPLSRKSEEYIFSDWMLNALNISVVDVFQGTRQFKVNFTDLVRLIYMEQNPNPKDVYKAPDVQSFVSDSREIRKVIFELLIGNVFSELYETLGSYKKADHEKNVAKAVLDEYDKIATELATQERVNSTKLRDDIQETEDRLTKLFVRRERLKSSRQNDSALRQMEPIKSDILRYELQHSELQKQLVASLSEQASMIELKNLLTEECQQLEKVLHTQSKLNLFSPNTCPYCLNDVARKPGHCVCGAKVEEVKYERFFYNEEEYYAILKSKKKSLETIRTAIDGVGAEVSNLNDNIRSTPQLIDTLKSKMRELLVSVDGNIDVRELDDIDDLIIYAKEELQRLEQRLEIELKIDDFQSSYDQKYENFQKVSAKYKELDARAKHQIVDRLHVFNEFYNTYMIAALPECRTARIDYNDYMPVINNGEYREASAYVHRRFLYFTTLLHMSLINEDMPYPRIVLMDNPRTSGIDDDNFNRLMDQVEKIPNLDAGQMILSTAPNSYPLRFEKYVKLVVDRNTNDYLLKAKQSDETQTRY